MKKIQGFTLIELMIVVAIIGILASWAVPSYINYTMRAARFDGQATATQVLVLAERFYTTNAQYPVTSDLTNDPGGILSEEGNFRVTLRNCGALGNTRCVEVMLNPVAGTLGEKVRTAVGGPIWIRSTGQKSPGWSAKI